jgi:hypothetical protein
MKKGEIKLSLILLVGGLGIIFCLFFFDIPFLPNLKYKSDVLDIRQYNRPYDYPTFQRSLPRTTYKSSSTYTDHGGLMTDPINTDNPGKGFQNEGNGYNFDNGSTMTGSPLSSQKTRIVGSTQGTGSSGGFYAYGKRNSSENRASGQAARGSMLAASELREPFSNSTPAPQRAPYEPNKGATDPGGAPLGNPIPAGNGLGVLLLLAAGYASFIKLRAKR